MNMKQGLIAGGVLLAIVIFVTGVIVDHQEEKTEIPTETQTDRGMPSETPPNHQTPPEITPDGLMPRTSRKPLTQPDTQQRSQTMATAPRHARLDGNAAGDTGTERPTVPPGYNEPDIPLTETAELLDFVRKTISDTGPQATETGRSLLDSEDAKMRQLGAIILAEQDALDEETLKRIAGEEKPLVALNTLGWVFDSGDRDTAELLMNKLISGGLNTDDLMGVLAGDELSESGSRAALDILSTSLSGKDAADTFATISADTAYAYGVRMKATMLLRDTMEFDAYRSHVEMARQKSSQSNDALWNEGITRLAKQLEGPAVIHDGPAILTPGNIDEMLAREYPMILEDLAQRVEYVLKTEESYVYPGTAARLAERIKELKNRPWSSAQQISMRRLESAAAILADEENPDKEPPQNYLPPPPGFS